LPPQMLIARCFSSARSPTQSHIIFSDQATNGRNRPKQSCTLAGATVQLRRGTAPAAPVRLVMSLHIPGRLSARLLTPIERIPRKVVPRGCEPKWPCVENLYLSEAHSARARPENKQLPVSPHLCWAGSFLLRPESLHHLPRHRNSTGTSLAPVSVSGVKWLHSIKVRSPHSH
jgi:hypothetical protein